MSKWTRWFVHRLPSVIAVFILIFGSSEVFAAGAIAQFDVDFGFGLVNAPPPGFTYIVFQFDSADQPQVHLRPSLFEDIRISSAVVGQEFFVSANTDPDFASIAQQITDGVDESIVPWHFEGPGITGAGSGSLDLESKWLGQAGHPDLTGHQVTSMSMFVKSYTSDMYFDHVAVTFSFFGVPEPPTVVLLSIGGIACLVAIRR
jgi:hypothetical protein